MFNNFVTKCYTAYVFVNQFNGFQNVALRLFCFSVGVQTSLYLWDPLMYCMGPFGQRDCVIMPMLYLLYCTLRLVGQCGLQGFQNVLK